MKRRVVITGIGTINPIGHNLEEAWENVKKGVCGIDFTKQIDTTNFKVKVSGEVICDILYLQQTSRLR